MERAASGRDRYQSKRIAGQSLDRSDGPAQAAHYVLGDEPRVALQEPLVLMSDLKDDPRQHCAAVKT